MYLFKAHEHEKKLDLLCITYSFLIFKETEFVIYYAIKSEEVNILESIQCFPAYNK